MPSVLAEGPRALPPALRRPMTIVAGLAAVLFTVVAARYAGEVAPGRVDQWIRRAVEGLWSEPNLGIFMIAVVGDPPVAVTLTILLAAVCLTLRRPRLAVVTVAGMGVAGVLATALKPVVGRTIHGDFLAYPSGHTAAATVLALVVMLLLVDLLDTGRLPGVLLILSGAGVAGTAMALSQIVLNVHYPTDTVGGFCTAMVVVPATAYLVDRVADRRARP